MKTVRFENPEGTRIVIQEGTAILAVPTDPAHPVWQQVMKDMAAGKLVIEPYEPPAPADE